jgi:hypothetical protein
MGGNSGHMMPGICTQGSLTCRKSATWDRSFYFPSEVRRAEDFYRPFKNPTASAGFEPANLGIRGQHANINFSQLWQQYVRNKNNAHLAAGILWQRPFLNIFLKLWQYCVSTSHNEFLQI